jgi:tRNA nucleotidyltransferase (CCA-adding enzyme)
MIKNNIELPVPVLNIIKKLESNNYQAFVVGGACRDSILGREVHDWDIATNAKPEQILEVFSKYKTIPTGIEHGTITVLVDDMSVEITTFRADGEYSDSRHPDKIQFLLTIKPDLARRDFTMNAIAYNPKIGFIDPYNGLRDISKKNIKCVGNPHERFCEDALRMLRAIRFSAQLNFELDSDTYVAIKTYAQLITKISHERVRDEINKILIYKPDLMYEVYKIDLLQYIIPELVECFNCQQNNGYHIGTVGLHSVIAMKRIEPQLLLRLTMLLHDIGKPVVKTTDENGFDHFYGHEEVSANMAEKILKDLRYENDIIEKCKTLILHHRDEIRGSARIVRRLLNTLGEKILRDLFKVQIADAKAQSEKSQYKIQNILDAEKILNDIIAKQQCFSIKDLKINGNDLINIGFEKGKELGDTLRNLLKLVLWWPFLNKKFILLAIARFYLFWNLKFLDNNN